MIARGIVCLFLFFGIAEAFVAFKQSRVYDEFDFKGQAAITIDHPCGTGCFIYASVTPESKQFAANLLIQLPKGFVSVAEVATRINPVSNLKSYQSIENTTSLTIVNANKQLEAGPLVLYIVSRYYIVDGTGFDHREVYEAEGLNRSISKFPYALTVMSARPFTLWQPSRESDAMRLMVAATMTGLDTLRNSVDCAWLYNDYSSRHNPEFTMGINGPIAAVTWEYGNEHAPTPHDPPAQLTASMGIDTSRSLDTSGWVGSPGAHGCFGLPAYRSSLYDLREPIHAELKTDYAVQLAVQVATSSDSVLLDPANGLFYDISSTPDHKPYHLQFNTKSLIVDWTPNGTGNDYFIVQWNATVPK